MKTKKNFSSHFFLLEGSGPPVCMSRLSFIMIIKITLCLKFLWQQRVGQLLRNSKKNNRIYSHLNFFLSHSFPTICSPRPFVRICGLPSLCSGLFSFSSSVCFTGILVSKQPLWFHISTFAMDLCVYFVHVWSKCSFLSGFFFSFLRISYSYNNMKHITWNKQNCVWQMAGKHITVMWLSLRSKHDIFIINCTNIHICMSAESQCLINWGFGKKKKKKNII